MRTGAWGTPPNCNYYPWLIAGTAEGLRKCQGRYFQRPGPTGNKAGLRIFCLYCTASQALERDLDSFQEDTTNMGPERRVPVTSVRGHY